MNYVIQRVPERNVDYLLEVVPEAFVNTDREGISIHALIDAFEHFGDEPFVQMEDDIILCKSFRERIEAVIDEHPDEFITFFAMRKWLKQPTVMAGKHFVMSQCFYVPANFPRGLRAFFEDRQVKCNPRHGMAFDLCLADFMDRNGWNMLVWVPNLVQHKVGPSVFNPNQNPDRQSYCFADDLEVANVN